MWYNDVRRCCLVFVSKTCVNVFRTLAIINNMYFNAGLCPGIRFLLLRNINYSYNCTYTIVSELIASGDNIAKRSKGSDTRVPSE